MQIRHLKTLLPASSQPSPLGASHWSPNGLKLALCGSDRVIMVYDEMGERKDKFATKGAGDSKDYSVTQLLFSPDSTRLAVGQSDGGLYVYKLGSEWGEKKTICNKFIQPCQISCIVWPQHLMNHLLFGGTDGKVRLGNLKSNKCVVVGEHNCPAISASCCTADSSFVLVGFLDGTIQRFYIGPDGSDCQMTRFVQHPCPPYSILWGSTILVAGSDRIIVSYDDQGRVQQKFDYTHDDTQEEFTTGQLAPNGQSALVGSFDRIHVFNYSSRNGVWKEVAVKKIENFYTVTALAWRSDESKLLAGSLSGCAELFECCLKRSRYQGKYDLNYLSNSQVSIKNLTSGQKVLLKSNADCEIEKINIYKDQFVVAVTSDTLIVADMASSRVSEVPWLGGGHEKFNFDYPNMCIIFNAGELSLVEYGTHQIIGSCRSEYMSSHLISFRSSRPKAKKKFKYIAYLADPNTINVTDLLTGITVATVTHDFKVDWLELSTKADKLLFRDKRQQLNLYAVDSRKTFTLLNYCSFVQWVENSDVIVAQNRQQLCVWYSVDSPESVTIIPIKGEVERIERKGPKTIVIVDEGSGTTSVPLDEGLIEFGASMEDKDYARAICLLEQLDNSPETEAMWRTLGHAALQDRKLLVAERCYAAVGDLSTTLYLKKTRELAEKIKNENPMNEDPMDHYLVRAKLAVLEHQFKLAESIYLEQGMVDDAMEMYQQLHKWDMSIKVAEARNHPELESLKHNYFEWLVSSGQEEKAAQIKEEEGDYVGAINLYLKGNMPGRAGIVLQQYGLQSNSDLAEKIAASLYKSGLFEKAGDLFHKLGQFQRALDAYKSGKVFHPAVELARRYFPQEVVNLELQWAEHLVTSRQFEAAVNHFIEAGSTRRAIEIAAAANMWKKVASMVDSLGTSKDAEPYYIQLAQHYVQCDNTDQAEKFFVLAGRSQDAIDMYVKMNKWEHAHRIASKHMSSEQLRAWIVKLAKEVEGKGKLKDAEKLYLTIEEPDLAIAMYKQYKQYEQMIRLVSVYHKDLLGETHIFLAKSLEAEMRLKEAEQHFIEGGDWKAAVNMYCANNQFEEAHRVAKTNGGPTASKQVAYIWAKFLGGEAAVKLLNKFGLLEAAVEFAAENGHFEFAFELARAADKTVLQLVFYKQAIHFEEAGRLKEAETAFIQAGKPKEAILMYVHEEDWESAFKIAEAHEPGSVNDILIGQAKSAFSKRDYPKAETLALRAQKPEVMIKLYRDNTMWKEALQFASEYLPAKVAEIHADYDRFISSGPAERRKSEDVLSVARNAERQRDFSGAITAYLQYSDGTPDQLEAAWTKAIELAQRFVSDRMTEVVATVSKRLANAKKFKEAGNLLASIDDKKGAVDMLVSGELWQDARAFVRQDPKLAEYVENAYIRFMKSNTKVEVTTDENTSTALDIFAQRGDWQKCLEKASENPNAFQRYAKFALQNLVKDKKFDMAVRLFATYGVPPDGTLYTLFDQTARHVLRNGTAESYAALREMLFKLVAQDKTSAAAPFERYLFITHLMALKEYCSKKKELQMFAARQAMALLRYTDVLCPIKSFYEAGLLSKTAGLSNMAFVCWNRFLDLTEAVEDKQQNASMIENSDFAQTDVPFDVPLPSENFDESKREQVRDWVLSVSLDQKVQQEIERRKCEMCSVEIYSGSLWCHGCQTKLDPCIVTGFPVLKNRVHCTTCKRPSNKDDWNKFVLSEKVCPWCGSQQTPSYSLGLSK